MITNVSFDHGVWSLWQIEATLWLFSVIAVVSSHCPETEELVRQAQLCVHSLSLTEKSSQFSIQPSATQDTSCSLYNESLVCVQTVVQDCYQYERDLVMAESIITALETGMADLCENKVTYNRYRHHADCYTKHEALSDHCLNQFNEKFQYVMKADSAHIDHSTWTLCRSFRTLITCIHTIILAQCGEDAADVFQDLVKAQVPPQVTSLCDSYISPTSPLSGSTDQNIGKSWILCLSFLYYIYFHQCRFC